MNLEGPSYQVASGDTNRWQVNTGAIRHAYARSDAWLDLSGLRRIEVETPFPERVLTAPWVRRPKTVAPPTERRSGPFENCSVAVGAAASIVIAADSVAEMHSPYSVVVSTVTPLGLLGLPGCIIPSM